MIRIAPKSNSASKQIAEIVIPHVAVAPNEPASYFQQSHIPNGLLLQFRNILLHFMIVCLFHLQITKIKVQVNTICCRGDVCGRFCIDTT
jgi:hypothetical protein